MENLNYKIIVNPAAGKGKGGDVAKAISEILTAHKKEFEIFHTKEPGHGIELAQRGVKDGWSAVVAVGGDGTVGEVVNGIMQADERKNCHFGFIPIGTGNDFARSLKIPLHMEEAIKVLVKPGRKVMDIGKEREGYFSIITGLGFPAEVMAQANAYKGPLRGSSIITWCVLKTIKELKAERIEFTLDGETVELLAKAIFVLNTPFTGGGLQIVPQAKIDDGFLDIAVMGDISKPGLAITLPKAYKGKHVGHPAFAFYKGKKVLIKTHRPLRKLFDGNVYGQSPLEAEILPQALSVLVPAFEGA